MPKAAQPSGRGLSPSSSPPSASLTQGSVHGSGRAVWKYGLCGISGLSLSAVHTVGPPRAWSALLMEMVMVKMAGLWEDEARACPQRQAWLSPQAAPSLGPPRSLELERNCLGGDQEKRALLYHGTKLKGQTD